MTVREFMHSVRFERLTNVAFLQDRQLSEPDKVGVLLSALLNCGGGAVVFGAILDDSGEAVDVVGVRTDAAAVREFEQQVLLSISPGAPVFVQMVSFEGKGLVVIDVPPGKDPPYASGNIIYALHEGRPEPALSAEIREWVLNSGAETNRWENRAAFANAMDGIERTALERAVREANESRRKVLDVHADTARLLSDFQMMRDGRLLNAGLVMFGRGVGRWLPQAQVRFVHFGGKTADSDILFSDLYDGPIGDTINEVRDYVVSHAPQVQVFDRATGNRRQEVAYPVMPVREALVNAFAHRDYESALGGVMVRMFSDRVEIANSGKLPEGITASALNAGNGVPSRLVNPLIANNLYFRGYMEHVGRGSVLIKDECRKVGTQVTWTTKTRGEVMVTLRACAAHQFIDESINQSINSNNGSSINIVNVQEDALKDGDLLKFADLIANNPCSRRPELQRLTGFSRGEVQGLLDKLKTARLVIYLGSKKTGGYYLMRMKDVDFDYKMIIQNCFDAEHTPEHCVHGGYLSEKVRNLILKLKKDGLIRCETDTATDSLGHFVYFGFTERGRELFLENGLIKAIYRV